MAGPPGEPQQGDTTERRAFVRYRFVSGMPVRFLNRAQLQSGIGILMDVSLSGISLLTDHALPVGATLVVRLPGRRLGGGRSRMATVVRMQREDNDYWLAGCRLGVPLSEEELRGLRVGGRALREKP
jgi:hypothetical protein